MIARVVREPNGVDVVLFHEHDVASHRVSIGKPAHVRVAAAVDSSYLHGAAVQGQFTTLYPHGADANALGVAVEKPSATRQEVDSKPMLVGVLRKPGPDGLEAEAQHDCALDPYLCAAGGQFGSARVVQ